jgi:capsular polysaccharide biosynthesis protein
VELVKYINILRRRWWIILVAVAFTVGSAYIFSELQAKRYTSVAEVRVDPARPDWGLAQSAKMFLLNYVAAANSNTWAQRVIDKLQLSMTPDQLRSKVHFAAEDSRMVIRIEVEDYDGEQANRVAAEWAQQLIDWRNANNARQRKEDRVYAELIDYPRYTQSWPPSTKIMLAAGATFGLVVAGMVIFFLEWLEAGVICTPQDLERELNLVVIGAIPSSN